MANVCVGCGLDVQADGKLVVSTVGATNVHPNHVIYNTPFQCTASNSQFPPIFCDGNGDLRQGAPEHTSQLGLTSEQYNFVPDEVLPFNTPVTDLVLDNPSCRTLVGWLQFASIATAVIGPGGAVNLQHNINTGAGFNLTAAWQQHNEGGTTRTYTPMRQLTLINYTLPPGLPPQLIRFNTRMTNVIAHANNRFSSVAQEIRWFGTTV